MDRGGGCGRGRTEELSSGGHAAGVVGLKGTAHGGPLGGLRHRPPPTTEKAIPIGGVGRAPRGRYGWLQATPAAGLPVTAEGSDRGGLSVVVRRLQRPVRCAVK